MTSSHSLHAITTKAKISLQKQKIKQKKIADKKRKLIEDSNSKSQSEIQRQPVHKKRKIAQPQKKQKQKQQQQNKNGKINKTQHKNRNNAQQQINSPTNQNNQQTKAKERSTRSFAYDLPLKKQRKRSVIKLTHMPSGMEEHQILTFFEQFAYVTRYCLKRRRHGRSTRHAFVEFGNPETAAIVCETLDTTFLYSEKLECIEIAPESVQGSRFFKTVDIHQAKKNNVFDTAFIKWQKCATIVNLEFGFEPFYHKMANDENDINQHLQALNIDYSFHGIKKAIKTQRKCHKESLDLLDTSQPQSQLQKNSNENKALTTIKSVAQENKSMTVVNEEKSNDDERRFLMILKNFPFDDAIAINEQLIADFFDPIPTANIFVFKSQCLVFVEFETEALFLKAFETKYGHKIGNNAIKLLSAEEKRLKRCQRKLEAMENNT